MPSPAQEQKPNIKILLRNGLWVYKIVYQFSGPETILVVILSFILAIFPTINAYLGGIFIDRLIKSIQLNQSLGTSINLGSPIVQTITLLMAAMAFRSLFSNLYSILRDRYLIVHSEKIRLELTRRIANLDVGQFENKDINNAIRRGNDNLYKIDEFFRSSTSLLGTLISIAITLVICIKFSPLFTLIIMLLCVPNNFIFARFTRQKWNFYNTTTEDSRRKWQLLNELKHQDNIPEHKITAGDKKIFDIVSNLNTSLWEKEIAPHYTRWKSLNWLTILDIIAYLATPLFLAGQTIIGKISIGQLTFFQSTYGNLYSNTNHVLSQFTSLRDTANYVSHVYDLWHTTPIIQGGNLKLDTKTPIIKFENVSFRYKQGSQDVLKNINLTINPGEEIAIVGENGAGKSTLIKLILRFYDPTKGRILINNQPIQSIDLKSYYRLIGTLFQQYNLYKALDVKNNIALGNTTVPLNMSKVKTAAKQAEAETFIEALDNKYNQMLSSSYTGGTNLSTGQWQKLALARMFYRDFQVLILDEPTASIDAEAEYKIFQRIYQTSKGKTLIIISHRFSTVRNAQRIYVLDQGKIVEQGSHDELVKLGGKYAKAFKLQAKGYSN